MVNASGIASILLILSATVVCGLADKQQASLKSYTKSMGQTDDATLYVVILAETRSYKLLGS